MPTLTRRRGFSLVEILVVIAIIGILVGLMLPAIQKIRQSFRRLESKNNLKTLALATMNFEAQAGFLPRSCGWNNKNNITAEGGANGTIFFQLLPYIEEQIMFNQCYGPLEAPGTDKNGYSTYDPNKMTAPNVQYKAPGSNVPQMAYRANRFGLAIGTNVTDKSIVWKNPKCFNTILNKTYNTGSYYAPTYVTSYLANDEIFSKGTSVANISASTIMFAEGWSTCGGANVYHRFNSDIVGYYDSENGCGTSSTQGVSRTNNWLVASESFQPPYDKWEYIAGQWVKTPMPAKLYTTMTQYDMTKSDFYNSNGAKFPINDIPLYTTGMVGGGGDGTYCGYPDGARSYGLMPVFSRGDPYLDPKEAVSSFRTPSTKYNYVLIPNSNPPQYNRIENVLTPQFVTYQHGQQNANLLATSPRCVWFAPQSFLSSLQVAMMDGAVKDISPSVSQATWDAAVSPDGADLIGTDLEN